MGKEKKTSYLTKFLKYLVYIVFIAAGFLIGRHILALMNHLPGNEDKSINNGSTPISEADVNINNVSNKFTSELKILKEDINKYN